MTIKLFAAAGIAAATIACAAIAQDWSAEPTFGSVSLDAGFTPDPYTVRITAGGSIDAVQRSGGECQGMIADAPDFSLYYTAGSFDLTFSASSSEDTTLVINGPDTSWYCDDDSGEGLNPRIDFSNPQSGRYDIWIGTYGSGSDLAESTLAISELGRE